MVGVLKQEYRMIEHEFLNIYRRHLRDLRSGRRTSEKNIKLLKRIEQLLDNYYYLFIKVLNFYSFNIDIFPEALLYLHMFVSLSENLYDSENPLYSERIFSEEIPKLYIETYDGSNGSLAKIRDLLYRVLHGN